MERYTSEKNELFGSHVGAYNGDQSDSSAQHMKWQKLYPCSGKLVVNNSSPTFEYQTCNWSKIGTFGKCKWTTLSAAGR